MISGGNKFSLREGSEILQVGKQTNVYDLHTRATFQAYVDLIIPLEALIFNIYEYIIFELDYSIPISIEQQLTQMNKSLSKSTAQLLDVAAIQLIQSGKAKCTLNVWAFPGGGPFAALDRSDRLRSITLLEKLEIDVSRAPAPYQNNPGLIRNMMDSINQLALFGYYSEWSAYGTTRLFPPNYRRLEYFPIGWIQSNYPGPAFGYRDFRGYLLTMAHIKGDLF
jgi:hypothetical protein